MNLLNKLVEEKSIENKTNKTKETIIWINNKEKIFLNQDLKNQLVEEMLKERNAKGERSIKTFSITYLKE